MLKKIDIIGENLRKARKKKFPKDDLKAFSVRIGVSRSTLQKMEAGELSVGLDKYYAAAEILDLTEPFLELFKIKPGLFDE